MSALLCMHKSLFFSHSSEYQPFQSSGLMNPRQRSINTYTLHNTEEASTFKLTEGQFTKQKNIRHANIISPFKNEVSLNTTVGL